MARLFVIVDRGIGCFLMGVIGWLVFWFSRKIWLVLVVVVSAGCVFVFDGRLISVGCVGML